MAVKDRTKRGAGAAAAEKKDWSGSLVIEVRQFTLQRAAVKTPFENTSSSIAQGNDIDENHDYHHKHGIRRLGPL